MNPRTLIEALSVAERLKDATRHCYTRNGRHESVAEHSWMMTLMAFFMKDEFPEVSELGFSILMALFLIVTYNDILRIGGRFLKWKALLLWFK